MKTGERQVFRHCLAAVKLRDNVIDLKGSADQGFRNQAILTAISRAPLHIASQCSLHRAAISIPPSSTTTALWTSSNPETIPSAYTFPIHPTLQTKAIQFEPLPPIRSFFRDPAPRNSPSGKNPPHPGAGRHCPVAQPVPTHLRNFAREQRSYPNSISNRRHRQSITPLPKEPR